MAGEAGVGLLGAAGPWRPAGVALAAGVAQAAEAEAAGVPGKAGAAGESFYKLTYGKGFSLYSTNRAYALQTKTKSKY